MDNLQVFGGVLAAYFALQILLNLLVMAFVRRSSTPPLTVIKGSFWAASINALFFILLAVLLRTVGGVKTPAAPEGQSYGMFALLGVLAGPLLWVALTYARKLGTAAFGAGEVVYAEEAILRHPPSRGYVYGGAFNLALLQPLGRELFMRGLLLPILAQQVGWGWAILGSASFEVLIRLNIAWVFQNLLYTLAMCGLFYVTGNAMACVTAAITAGTIQAVILIRVGFRRARDRAGRD